MENADNIIGILKTCFQVCVAFTAMFFVINVVLFFVFDIRTLFNIRTGRAKRKTIKEMQAANDSTGRLRVGGKTLTAQLDKEEGKRKKLSIIPPPKQDSGSSATTVLQYDSAPTDVLEKVQGVLNEYDPGSAPTSQLSVDSVRSQTRRNEYDDDYGNKDIHFVITKYLVYIHTEERIV